MDYIILFHAGMILQLTNTPFEFIRCINESIRLIFPIGGRPTDGHKLKFLMTELPFKLSLQRNNRRSGLHLDRDAANRINIFRYDVTAYLPFPSLFVLRKIKRRKQDQIISCVQILLIKPFLNFRNYRNAFYKIRNAIQIHTWHNPGNR